MKQRWQIIFGGVGGQGLMLAGTLLGKAAVEHEGLNAVMTSAYGVETRGTFTKSDVIVSIEEIDYPEVLHPDVVIALDLVAYKKYVASLEEGALLLYDDAFGPLTAKAKQIGFSVSGIAKEIGNPAVANVVALGILLKLTGIVGEQAAVDAIRDEFRERANIAELNVKALQAGIEAASSINASGVDIFK